MKIFAYEVRKDEIAAFSAAAAKYHVEIVTSTLVPTLENAGLAAGCDGVTILGQGRIDRKLLERYQVLGIRCLSTRTIGSNHIDLQAAHDLGIQVCSADYPPNGVADFTVMMILMCLRHYKQAMWRGQVNDFSLEGLQGRDMKSLTIGIVGTGRIGVQVLRELSGFGCRLLAWSRHENPEALPYAQYTDLDTLLRTCDVISLHMPLTDATHHFIDREAIGKMKPGVIRTDIDALIEGIETEKIGALGMDTVEGEEGIVHGDHRTDILSNRNWFYLHQFRNVVMTQHMAFYTQEAVESMVRCGVEGIVEMDRTGTYPTKL